MNAFASAQEVEAASMAIIVPYLEWRSDGRLVLTAKGKLGKFLQESVGDALVNLHGGRMYSIECKAESENVYGNFFLETWSNRNLDHLSSHAAVGSNPGWLLKLRSDLLFYHFVYSNQLFIINLFRLQQWAFGHGEAPGQIYQHDERKQGKRVQRNDTWGRCVPIGDVRRALGAGNFKELDPRQLELWESAA